MVKNRPGKGMMVMVIGLVIMAMVALVGVSLYEYTNSVRNEGIGHELSLSAQYQDNQNELSTFISNFREQMGISERKSEKIHDILVGAVKGRYESQNGNVGYGKGSPFFSAIMEAYPDLKGLDMYDKVASLVSSGREAYKAKQSKLLDQLRAYDNWRKQGFVRSWLVNQLGFPSDNLEARIGTKVSRAKDARDQMYLIVLASDAKNAYETGTLEPLKVK